MTLLLLFLRERGLCAAAAACTTAADRVATDFAQHLHRNQGLAAATVENYTRLARQFLAWRFGQAEVCLHDLRPSDSIAFIRQESKRMAPPAVKGVANTLRSFLRFCEFCGEVSTGLAAGVPSVATWTTTPPTHRESCQGACVAARRPGQCRATAGRCAGRRLRAELRLPGLWCGDGHHRNRRSRTTDPCAAATRRAMSISRYAIRSSALRRSAPIANGFVLPSPTVVSGPTDGRKTCRIRGAAPRFNDTLVSLPARSPPQAFRRPFKSP